MLSASESKNRPIESKIPNRNRTSSATPWSGVQVEDREHGDEREQVSLFHLPMVPPGGSLASQQCWTRPKRRTRTDTAQRHAGNVTFAGTSLAAPGGDLPGASAENSPDQRARCARNGLVCATLEVWKTPTFSS